MKSRVRRCESTARIASVSFPHGLAPETQHRPASCMAARGDAIHKSLQNLIPQRCHGKGRLTKPLREAVESGMSGLNHSEGCRPPQPKIRVFSNFSIARRNKSNAQLDSRSLDS